VRVARGTVVGTLAKRAGISRAAVNWRLAQDWFPTAKGFSELLQPLRSQDSWIEPYPFLYPQTLESDWDRAGPCDLWQCEWAWDGIRAQVMRRGEKTLVWSSSQELLNPVVPDIVHAVEWLPEGTVLDGLIVLSEHRAARKNRLKQTRLKPGSKSNIEQPEKQACFMARDLLAEAGVDLRSLPLRVRRQRLESMINILISKMPAAGDGRPAVEQMSLELFPANTHSHLESHSIVRVSPVMPAASWDLRRQEWIQARSKGARGLELRRLDASHESGAESECWWFLPNAPLTVNAVLMRVQTRPGQRPDESALHTFGVWSGQQLVAVAEVNHRLAPAESASLEDLLRSNLQARRGPVRFFKPSLVFQLAFENVEPASRRASGLILKSARVLRWLKDVDPDKAASLADLRQMIHPIEDSTTSRGPL
jgi:DNA ligase 1